MLAACAGTSQSIRKIAGRCRIAHMVQIRSFFRPPRREARLKERCSIIDPASKPDQNSAGPIARPQGWRMNSLQTKIADNG